MSNKIGVSVIAALAGVVVGAGLGVLFAPDKGKETRKKIVKGLEESKEDLSERLDVLKKQVKTIVENKKQDFNSGLDNLVSETGKKTEDVISALEVKLADLKKEANKMANRKEI